MFVFRRKRKWDQPAESFISAVPGVIPLGNVGSPMLQAVSAINTTQQLLTPSLQQHAVTLVQKINQVRL